MPFTILPTVDTDATVTRFAANSIIQDLKYKTSFQAQDVIWLNDTVTANTTSALGPNEIGMQPIAVGEYIYVDYQDIPSESRTDIRQSERNFPAFFSHHDLGIHAWPVMQETRLEMSIRLRSRSHDTMKQWLARFRRNHNNRNTHDYHTINFNYLVPRNFLAYLYDVHSITQLSVPDPSGPTELSEFLQSSYREGVVKRSNLSGSKKALAVNNEVTRILGVFGDMPQTPERNREEGYSEVAFEYFVDFPKPIGIRVQYQPTIHNARVDSAILQYLDPHVLQEPLIPSLPTTIAEVFDFNRELSQSSVADIGNHVYVDPIDRFHPSRYAKDTLTLLMIPICLDLNDLHALENLESYVNTLDPTLSAVMSILPECLTVDNAHGIHVEAFAVDSQEVKLDIEVDSTLNVRVLEDQEMNPRKRHYIRVSLAKDLSSISDVVVEGLLVSLEAIHLVRYWNNSIQDDGSTGALRQVGVEGQRRYTRHSWDSVVAELPRTSRLFQKFNSVQFHVVNQNTLVARRLT